MEVTYQDKDLAVLLFCFVIMFLCLWIIELQQKHVLRKVNEKLIDDNKHLLSENILIGDKNEDLENDYLDLKLEYEAYKKRMG